MSRGLSRLEAERLIVRGFFQPILDRINSDEVRESLAAELELRMGARSAT
jgi:Fe-S cluster assembly protein SufD